MNKFLAPSILGVIILIAGISAFSPIEQATTVHTTIIGDNQTTAEDTERVMSFNIDAGAAITALVLVPDNNVVLVGTVSAAQLDDSAVPGTDSNIECVNTDATVVNLTGANDLDSAGDVLVATALTGTCESIRVDAADGAQLIINVYINNWPEV